LEPTFTLFDHRIPTSGESEVFLFAIRHNFLAVSEQQPGFQSRSKVEALIVQPFPASIQAEPIAVGKRISLTTSLANHNCQVSKGIKSLHRSHCSGVLSFGIVQCKVCLALAIPVFEGKAT
jgi:hypothetical protein